MEQEVFIDGTIEDVVYSNPENGYSVIDISCDKKLITAVGIMPSCSPGEKIRLRGQWVTHPSFGKQFKASACERSMPKTAGDMLRYLSGGTIKGIGPATAAKIVERFGEDTFNIMEHEPLRLSEIKGITKDKALDIGERFKNQFAVREVIIALERFGLNSSECLNAYNALGITAVERISENPYILCSDKVGMRFERVDEIAATFPEGVRDILRQRAGVVHILRHNLRNGHTCLPRVKIFVPAEELLGMNLNETNEVIDDLITDKELVEEFIEDKSYIFLPYEYMDEKSIADRIKIMLRFPPAKGRTVDKDIDKIEEKKNIRFEEKQREAIRTAVTKGLLVLTGGPGTGKTTTLNGILDLYEKQKLRVLLAAPTGRAAKRMSEVTGRNAKTIHRLLEVAWTDGNRQTFGRNIENPLEADAVIIDELSMVDTHLFAALLNALPLGCRLVMVGDSDQLPPVGAGNVLQDIISSELLPVVALTEVFRQSLESLIVTNAHRIVRGEYPELTRTDKDFFFLSRGNIYSCADTVVELYTKRLPSAYGYEPTRDIQIICPSKKGELGTFNLNNRLQQLVNPPSPDKEDYVRTGRVFRVGDKVMQTKNNYDIVWTKGKETSSGIFNGDIGFITAINFNASFMKINFDGRIATYPFDNVSDLDLAYAVTVHKSQGSEFEAVIMPVFSVIPQLSYRNLLYTAVTRAKNRLILVGSAEQVNIMVDNDKKTRRYSALKYMLRSEK
ncbi:MAG: ATP-dependent RecD-like DNA helicase [Acutalibacteraceae bacterium]|nr:ATP-dependent RecD-like DNA helicase [Acutalibacteraceae bacterium]